MDGKADDLQELDLIVVGVVKLVVAEQVKRLGLLSDPCCLNRRLV